MCAQLPQSCPTLCDPMDSSLPGSSFHGILQARILEWVAISFAGGGLPDPGIKPRSPALQADSSPSEPPGKPIHQLYFSKKESHFLMCVWGMCVCLEIIPNYSNSLASPALAGKFFTTSAACNHPPPIAHIIF